MTPRFERVGGRRGQAELAQLAKDDSEKMTTAMAAITKQAWDTCKVNLHYS